MFPSLAQELTKTESGSTVCSYHKDLGLEKPILTLIHGYPQSAFMYVYTTSFVCMPARPI